MNKNSTVNSKIRTSGYVTRGGTLNLRAA